MAGERPYELIVFGATGYTGKLTAEYIQEHVATDLKWAIAGRNRSKLEAVIETLKKLNSDRPPPAIEISDLKRDELETLASKTKVLISTVGPYHKYGTVVLEACIASKTHHLDVTGETPWVYDMMKKHHQAAKDAGVCFIPQCGIDSVPADVMVYVLADKMQKDLGCGMTTCVGSLQDIKGGFSGGTLSTVLTVTDSYSTAHLLKSMAPFSLSAIKPPKDLVARDTFVEKLLGARTIEGLGPLTDSPQGATDITIVNRSWSLFNEGSFYGKKFNYSEWMRVRSTWMASLVHYGMGAFIASFYIPGMKWVYQKYVTQPGDGPKRDATTNNDIRYKAIAAPENGSNKTGQVDFYYKGDLYYLTGVLVAEAAMTLLRGGDVLAKRLNGMVTSATLEMEYVDRLRKAGVQLEAQILDRSSKL